MTVRRGLFEIILSEAVENDSHVDKQKILCIDIVAWITGALS